MGLICGARHNGTAADNKTISDATSAAAERTIGSCAETPKTRLLIQREALQLPASPIVNSMVPSLAASLPVRRKVAKVPAPIVKGYLSGDFMPYSPGGRFEPRSM